MFFGMMFGAVGWGTCSDLMGRSTAFNATLFFTALFGILAGFAPNFFWLCVIMFFLGSAVGVREFLDSTNLGPPLFASRRAPCLRTEHCYSNICRMASSIYSQPCPYFFPWALSWRHLLGSSSSRDFRVPARWNHVLRKIIWVGNIFLSFWALWCVVFILVVPIHTSSFCTMP